MVFLPEEMYRKCRSHQSDVGDPISTNFYPSGMIMIPFIFGVISSVQFSFRSMSAFDLITILVLAAGGLGLFLNSLRALDD